ncbi:MAG TPA: hypothetical protein VM243_21295 [Phycisphaerae bacterium]|nr:hypothetical protein [Phycisphaerae bacterium]
MDLARQTNPTGATISRFAVLCVGLGLAVSVVLALLSDGSYQDDALTHYLYARWGWHSGQYLVDEWGRPGLTCLLFPVAALGWTACRIESAVLSAAAAWLAYDIARRLGWRRAGWVPLLCFVQPIFLLASYTTLTETAVAFYLTLAVWCLVTGRRAWSAAVLSLCFVTRYETVVFIPLWVAAMRPWRGRWTWCALLLWAPLVHHALGAAILGRWPIAFIINEQQTTMYGAGMPLTMVVKSMATSGPAVAVLALVGSVALLWRGHGGGDERRQRDGIAWLIPACYLVHLLVHSLIFWLGLYASGGYPRFLVSTSPVAALCALFGLNAILDGVGDRRRRALAVLVVVSLVMWVGLELEAGIVDEAWLFLIEPVRWFVRGLTVLVLVAVARIWTGGGRLPGAVLGAAAVVTTVLPLAYLVRPHGIPEHTRDIERAVGWVRSSPYGEAPVIATNMWVSHYLDRGSNVVPPDSTTILDEAALGTVFIWDGEYSPTPRFAITPESMTERSGWRLVWRSAEREGKAPFACVYVRE